MIVITGATGQYGRLVVDGLLREVEPARVAVSVREPEKATDLAERGVRVRRGDFAEPASLAEAFEGAEQVLIVSANKLGDEAVRWHGNAIDAAKNAGAKRILYTSHQNAGLDAIFVPGRNHAATEELLSRCGVDFVSLRNGFYAQSALLQLGGVKAQGVIAVPADGPVSWTSRQDLAEVAVRILLHPSLFEGITPPLTALAMFDFAGIAKLAAEILGREVRREVVSDAAYKQRMLDRGVPEMMADALGTLFTASRAGEFAVVDPTLERVLGRKPEGMDAVLRGFLAEG